jgi:hypothetical protein
MGMLDDLLGNEQLQKQYKDFVKRYEQGEPFIRTNLQSARNDGSSQKSSFWYMSPSRQPKDRQKRKSHC